MRLNALKMIFGFSLLFILGGLAAVISFGKVSGETSFGLEPIITTLATLAGAFAGWAFRHPDEVVPPQMEKKDENEDQAVTRQA